MHDIAVISERSEGLLKSRTPMSKSETMLRRSVMLLMTKWNGELEGILN